MPIYNVSLKVITIRRVITGYLRLSQECKYILPFI